MDVFIFLTGGIICGETSKWQYAFKGEKNPVKNAQRVDHTKGKHLVSDFTFCLNKISNFITINITCVIFCDLHL